MLTCLECVLSLLLPQLLHKAGHCPDPSCLLGHTDPGDPDLLQAPCGSTLGTQAVLVLRQTSPGGWDELNPQ